MIEAPAGGRPFDEAGKLALANIAYNLTRLAWLERQAAPA